MDSKDLEYFSAFLKEFQDETDRGAALVGAALIDTRLERLLTSHFLSNSIGKEMVTGSNAPLGSFSSRIKMSYALGLITEIEFKECDLIRRIRNEFAHSIHGLNFQNQKLSALCNNLKANTPDRARFNSDSRKLFVNSVIMVSMSLWYRPEYAAPYKAQLRAWSWQLISDTVISK